MGRRILLSKLCGLPRSRPNKAGLTVHVEIRLAQAMLLRLLLVTPSLLATGQQREAAEMAPGVNRDRAPPLWTVRTVLLLCCLLPRHARHFFIGPSQAVHCSGVWGRPSPNLPSIHNTHYSQ